MAKMVKNNRLDILIKSFVACFLIGLVLNVGIGQIVGGLASLLFGLVWWGLYIVVLVFVLWNPVKGLYKTIRGFINPKEDKSIYDKIKGGRL